MTGAATSPPCVDPVKTYEVRVAGDEIQVKLA
jgi:nitrite reductase/ring-hydroxylating ferredoxin subunit